jgi:signal transduction histidine kinase
VRRRIVIAIVGSVVATVALFGLPLAWAVGRAYQDELRLRLESAALAASPELTEPGKGLTVPEPPLQGQGVRIAYYDTAGRRIAGIGPSAADGVVRDALGGSNGLADHAVAVPVSRDDRIIGVVRAEERSGLLADRVHNAWLLMGGLALVVVAAVTALATALVRRLTAPVQALADAAQRLEHGDFAVAPAPSGIAELDSAGMALAAAAQRLEAVLARERALTSDVTHQLRTPLTALRLELEAGAAREQGPDVDAVLAQVDRLEATIASLLALARESASEREPIELGPALRGACAPWSRFASASGRTLAVEVAPAGQRARVSEQALRQIVDVLVDNALQHGRGRVTVRAHPVASGVEVEVHDEGAATLDPEAIFARRSASARGHGIGLALARSLAEAEGGRLRLASGGGGTSFSLLLLGPEAPANGGDPTLAVAGQTRE